MEAFVHDVHRSCPFAARAPQGMLTAPVKIDTERAIGDIDPLIYASFIEHLGRCIEGGIFEEGLRSQIRAVIVRTCSMPPASST